MKRTPRVVIPPPRIEVPKKRCVQERTARSSAQSTHSEKAVFSAETTPRGVIPTQPQRPEGSNISPHIEVPKKCKTGAFITAPNRVPTEIQRSGFGGKRTSDRESESCRLRRDEGFVVRSDDGEGFVVRSDDGQHRICLVCGEAAALPNALGGAWPHTPFSGRSPHPLLATIGEKHEKRYQIQHAHGVRRP